jgi:PPP family 3-phenylpropionic acid transporter
MAAFSLAKVVYTPLIAMAADRGRWVPAMLSLHAVLGLAATGFVFLDLGLIGLIIVFFVIGLGFGTILPLVEASVLEKTESGSYGRMRLWGSVGFVAVAMVGGLIFSDSRIGGVPLALGLVFTVLFLVSIPLEDMAKPSIRHETKPARLPWRVYSLLGILTLNQVSHGPYYAFLSVHLKQTGLGSSTLSMVWSFAVLAELGAFLLGPTIQKRWDLRFILGLALFLTPVRWLLLAVPVSLPVVVIAQLGHAFSFALAHLAGVQLVQFESPPETARFAQALYSGLCFGFGIVVGSAVSGWLYGMYGGPRTFLAAATLSTAGFLFWLGLARSLSRRSRS